MLTTLSTVKSRLGILEADSTNDALLNSAIKAVSARFERECRRTFARAENAVHEFDASDTEIFPACYPIEFVAKFELKTDEAEGWQEQTGVEYVIRAGCIVSLRSRLSALSSSTPPALARVTYTGGYLLPGSADVLSATRLPDDLEQAAVEQVAWWFRNREKTGLVRTWPHDGTFEAFLQSDLLLEVRAVLKTYERFIL